MEGHIAEVVDRHTTIFVDCFQGGAVVQLRGLPGGQPVRGEHRLETFFGEAISDLGFSMEGHLAGEVDRHFALGLDLVHEGVVGQSTALHGDQPVLGEHRVGIGKAGFSLSMERHPVT